MITESNIIIGCMSWGSWGKQLSVNEQAAMIDYCVAHGNTTFDHADIYGGHSTEITFGKALKNSSVQRQDVHLISKCGIQLEGNIRNNRVKHYQYDKSYIINSVNASLRNFNTHYLDTFLLHRPSPLMHPHEIAEAITQLKIQGKINRFGVSNFNPSQVNLIADSLFVEVNQVEFSLSQPEAMYNGVLDQMLQKHMQPMAWSPMGAVFKTNTPQTSRILDLTSQLSEKYNTTPDTLLLAWILKHPAAISPVIGTTNKQRILYANQALEIKLDLQDWFMLLEASTGVNVP